MKSVTTLRFRKALKELPPGIRKTAEHAFQLWQENTFHPGLKFKQIHKRKSIYSVRVGLAWRAIGIKEGDTMIWF